MSKTLTAGQIFARDMRKNLGIGTRTRRFSTKKYGGNDMHHTILEAIANATFETGYYSEQRQAIFRTAFAAYSSYEKHIHNHRASAELVSHINAMTPWQFCNLLGEMIDAGISNVGEGEKFFRQMREKVFASSVPVIESAPVEVVAASVEAIAEPEQQISSDIDIVRAFEGKADQVAVKNGWTIGRAESVMLRYLRDTAPAEAATIAAALQHRTKLCA